MEQGHFYPLSRTKVLAAADGWDLLAEEQTARTGWDRHSDLGQCARKATLYREVATEIRASVA